MGETIKPPLFDLRKMVYVEQIWFLALRDGNWLCIVYKDAADGPWLARYRFKYLPTGEMNAYDVTLEASEKSRMMIIEAMDAFADRMKQEGEGVCERHIVQGDGRKAAAIIIEQPWYQHGEVMTAALAGPCSTTIH